MFSISLIVVIHFWCEMPSYFIFIYLFLLQDIYAGPNSFFESEQSYIRNTSFCSVLSVHQCILVDNSHPDFEESC
jgi:hypothetical protein